MSFFGAINSLIVLGQQAREAVQLMVRAPYAAADQLWADTTRQAQQDATLDRIVGLLDDIRNTLTYNTSQTVPIAPISTPTPPDLDDAAFPLYQCGDPNCRCDQDPNYLPRPDTSAAPGAGPVVEAETARAGQAPQPPGAGHLTSGRPCSAPSPYSWAECTKPAGHVDRHGCAGIFWSNSTK